MAGSESDTETSTRNPGAGHAQNGNGMPAGYSRTDAGLTHPPARLGLLAAYGTRGERLNLNGAEKVREVHVRPSKQNRRR